jgi:hypothetical protein
MKKPRALRDPGGGQRRFVAYRSEPEKSVGLPDDHAAVVEGRTLFPGNVVGPFSSPRLLVSGKNNPKTGATVMKGAWAGWPIYTLTLEERKTCPRSCAQWQGCYGNAMQWPRRNDAFHEDFIAALAAEVITVARQHPDGFVVRLHVLGDFYSARYVLVWAHLLRMLPNLHVYGYTARRVDRDDAESRKTAAAIAVLTSTMWDRFAIRTSHTEAGAERAIVVDEDPKSPDIIICPAQTEATEACATCGLCWAGAARSKTIAFLKHGLKTSRGRKPKAATPAAPGSPAWWASREGASA